MRIHPRPRTLLWRSGSVSYVIYLRTPIQVFRLRHLVPVAAPSQPSVGTKRNTNNLMIRVLLLHLTLGNRRRHNWVPSIRCAALVSEPQGTLSGQWFWCCFCHRCLLGDLVLGALEVNWGERRQSVRRIGCDESTRHDGDRKSKAITDLNSNACQRLPVFAAVL